MAAFVGLMTFGGLALVSAAIEQVAAKMPPLAGEKPRHRTSEEVEREKKLIDSAVDRAGRVLTK